MTFFTVNCAGKFESANQCGIVVVCAAINAAINAWQISVQSLPSHPINQCAPPHIPPAATLDNNLLPQWCL
jgi:hypothetical protein